jgi:Glycosyltransferases, probably involved in cell wall biogenesis
MWAVAAIESDETLSVSVVVPSIGRGVLADVVTQALAQGSAEVVVVADAHPEVVAQVLADAGLTEDPRLRVLQGAGLGAAPARQCGVEAVTGDLVLVLDDDVVPGPDLIAGHRRAHAAGPDRVVVGYMPVAPDLVARRVTAVIYSNDYEAECRILDADPSRVLYQLWAGNLSMRRTDCERVPQAVDTFIGIPREDEEFGFRCLRAGLVGVFDRSLVAVHFHDRPVSAFLALARAQAGASDRLHELYPDLVEVGDPAAGLPAAARWVVRAASAPVIGVVVRGVVVRIATWLGRGAPTRLRVRAVAFARAVVQA